MPTLVFLPILITFLSAPAAGVWDFDFARAKHERIMGQVLTASKDSIMINKMFDIRNKNGVVSLPFHVRLATGGYNRLGIDPFTYRACDVLAGDSVTLLVIQLDKGPLFCTAISIYHRPGGKVPPSPLYREGDWQPSHEVIEAVRLSHKGIPFPPHLDPFRKKWEFPAFDPAVPRRERLKRFPYENPYTYIQYAFFLR